jgi:hypothetical protein
MGRWRPTLLHKLVRVVEHRAFEVPVGLSVLSRYRPAELRLRRPTPPPLRFSDAPLYEALFARYPEARLEAVRLDARSPLPAARRFVEEQARLMQQQQKQPVGEAEAFQQVEARLKRRLETAGDARAGRGTLLSQLQDEEEGVLSGALRQRRKKEQQVEQQKAQRQERAAAAKAKAKAGREQRERR